VFCLFSRSLNSTLCFKITYRPSTYVHQLVNMRPCCHRNNQDMLAKLWKNHLKRHCSICGINIYINERWWHIFMHFRETLIWFISTHFLFQLYYIYVSIKLLNVYITLLILCWMFCIILLFTLFIVILFKLCSLFFYILLKIYMLYFLYLWNDKHISWDIFIELFIYLVFMFISTV